MADAFISYRRDPSAMAASLVQEKLKNKHNIDAYLDVNRADSTRVQFPQRLMQAIGDAPTFILMLADTTLESEWVRKEIQRAYELQKHCIPIFQESYKPTDISDPAIDYVLSFDGEHLFDRRNIHIDVSIDIIANLVVKSSQVQTPPIVVTPQKPQIDIPPKPKIILPQPFDWCYISAGKVTLTTDAYHKNIYITHDKEVDVSAFWMAKYPITNGQYAQFLQYESNYFRPQMWDDKSHNNYPVVGVTWRNAMDFCLWLSRITGFHVTLPTDEQWQRAAQGDTNSVYPWGNEFTPDGVIRSNTSEAGNGKIMPVNQYPAGASYFDVMDMAGNVWEYCLTHYTSGRTDGDDDKRILRGGSYDADKSWCRNTFRIPRDTKELWNKGFRIVCSIS